MADADCSCCRRPCLHCDVTLDHFPSDRVYAVETET
jgi:hypothetical protein